MSKTLQNLYRKAEYYFFEAISKTTLVIDEDAIAYMTGVNTADLNIVCVINKLPDLINVINKSKEFYNTGGVPYIYIIPKEYCTTEVKHNLQIAGYTHQDNSVALSLDLETLSIDIDQELDKECTIKSTDNKLEEWMSPLIEAFGSTPELSSQYARTHQKALNKGSQLLHFSLYKSAQVVSSITLSIHDDIARIDDLGTLPALQRNGFASKLFAHVLLKAKKLGAKKCFLEASSSGLSMYKKFGFDSLFVNNIYSLNSEGS